MDQNTVWLTQSQIGIFYGVDRHAPIEVKTLSNVHDRFLCIDDTVYHIGASLKDLGKKLFAFSRMELAAAERWEKYKFF